MLAERDGKSSPDVQLRDDQAMYGRTGAAPRNIRFSTSMFVTIRPSSIRFAGSGTFEAGAGGSFKQLRGLEPETPPVFTTSSTDSFAAPSNVFSSPGARVDPAQARDAVEHSQLKRDRKNRR